MSRTLTRTATALLLALGACQAPVSSPDAATPPGDAGTAVDGQLEAPTDASTAVQWVGEYDGTTYRTATDCEGHPVPDREYHTRLSIVDGPGIGMGGCFWPFVVDGGEATVIPGECNGRTYHSGEASLEGDMLIVTARMRLVWAQGECEEASVSFVGVRR